MGRFYDVYRMQVAPEVSKIVQVAERESVLKAYGRLLDDQCDLYEFGGMDIRDYDCEEESVREFFDSEGINIGQVRITKGERLSTAVIEDYINDTKVVYLMEEVD